MSDGPVVVQVQELLKQFDSAKGPVLGPLSFAVSMGETVAVVGPSGCGKSTLARIILDLEQPTAGAVRFHSGSSRPRLSWIPQGDSLYPWQRLTQLVRFPLLFGEDLDAGQESRIARLIAEVGLDGFEQSFPAQLSGGMRQRAAFARALVSAPDLLIMDEPFGSLDALSRRQQQEFLSKVCEREDITALVVTHDIDEAAFVADRVIVLTPRPGRIAAEVPVTMAHPRTKATRDMEEFRRIVRSIEARLI